MPPEQLTRARRWLYQRRCLGVESSSPDLERIQVRAYFENKQKIETLQRSLARAFPEVDSFRSTTVGLSYEPNSKSDFRPFPLTEDIWVFPAGPRSGESEEERARKIFLNPGSVFGTGRHETTQLIAQLMVSLNVRPGSLLDVGAGTGILAILGNRLGIERIDAVEICPQARSQARQNFRVNGLDEIGLFPDLRKAQHQYEVIVANLLTPTILHLKRDLQRRLSRGGVLLLSGITPAETDEIREAFPKLRLEKQIQSGDWTGMMFTCPRRN